MTTLVWGLAAASAEAPPFSTAIPGDSEGVMPQWGWGTCHCSVLSFCCPYVCSLFPTGPSLVSARQALSPGQSQSGHGSLAPESVPSARPSLQKTKNKI